LKGKTMNQELLDHIDSTLRNKTLPVKKKSKADIVMQKMFDDPNHESTLREGRRQLSRANRPELSISGGPQEMNEMDEAHDTFMDSLKGVTDG
jgi:hypothetical protein